MKSTGFIADYFTHIKQALDDINKTPSQ